MNTFSFTWRYSQRKMQAREEAVSSENEERAFIDEIIFRTNQQALVS
jgi:hypothetical protein